MSAADLPPGVAAHAIADDALWLDVEPTDPDAVVLRLLEHAATHGASDLFFCAEEHYASVSVRHLGLWRRVAQLPADFGRHCLALVKTRAGMDITEHRRPQDGRWKYERRPGAVIDLRVNFLPTLHGEDCALRLLDRDTALLSIDALGLPVPEYNQLLKMLTSPSGLILVTGPTAAGKTTTLYACLSHLNDGRRKINTIEDPVEYALAGVRQSQVNPRLHVGFADLLPGVLRQAPDVVMLGEVRDPETAKTAVRAAASGHLVLATLHAPQAAGAVQAMLHLGVPAPFLASSLLGVVAQRLVRTLNPKYHVAYELGPAAGFLDEVSHLLPAGHGTKIYGPGPEGRGKVAYVGRTGIFEVLLVNRAIREAVVQGQPVPVLHDLGLKAGMIPMRHAALLAVARGQTSLEEVIRVVPAEYLLE